MDHGGGESVTTYRANIVSGEKVELLSNDPHTMSVPERSQLLQTSSLHLCTLISFIELSNDGQ